jgi:hypothetical protein
MKRGEAEAALQQGVNDQFSRLFGNLCTGLTLSRDDVEKAAERFNRGVEVLLKAHTIAHQAIVAPSSNDKAEGSN